MLLTVHSAAVLGVQALMIDVEVDLTVAERHYYHVVGLPDTAIKESGKRVKAAIRNCGFDFPLTGNITVNLAPADFKKEGSCYDLPVALALLGITGALNPRNLQEWIILGELSLDGQVRPIRGALPVTLSAKKNGFSKLLLPADNTQEAAVVKGVEVYPANTLSQVIDLVNGSDGDRVATKVDHKKLLRTLHCPGFDLAEVKGQVAAKRALEVACAGGHNILLIGPPGAGKTMLAKRMPSIIPSMTFSEALETTAVHSVCGLLPSNRQFVGSRPFRAPHHTISAAGLVGGSSIPRPGEASLAHNGILFLDELPEFQRHVLEVLRQPLEDGSITISRAARTLSFPSKFMLVAAMNPCPCGYYNSLSKDCICTPAQIHRYLAKISGPLLDRIDLHVDVPEVNYKELTTAVNGEPSSQVSKRVTAARKKQMKRLKQNGFLCNSQMGPKQIQAHCALDAEGKTRLETAIQKLGFSARAYDRVLKVSRTIADLDASESIRSEHIAEAINYRSLDRNFWEGF